MIKKDANVKKVMFDEQVALSYDDDDGSMFHSDVLDPTVDFLEALVLGLRGSDFGLDRTGLFWGRSCWGGSCAGASVFFC